MWTYEADGVWPFEGGEAAQGTSGVVDAVTNGTGTIGYADASRAGDLGTVAVQVGDEFVPVLARGRSGHRRRLARSSRAAPTATSPSSSTAPPTEAGVYPIVLVAYSIACQQYEDAAKGELVKAYFSYIASEDGQAVAAENAGSAPISDSLREQAVAAIDSIQ